MKEMLPAVEETDKSTPAPDRTRLLIDVIQELSLARDLDTVMRIVRHAARELTGADGATFILRDGDLCYYADEDAISPLWKGQRFPMTNCVSGWAMNNQKAAVIPDITQDDRVPLDAYLPTFVRSMAMVPIRAREPIGAIGNYWAGHHAATAAELELLQALADSTSIALENIELYNALERRVAERTAELEAANRELEAFGYTVAHDLRAPLTVIRGWAELLSGDDLGEVTEPVQAAGRSTAAAAERMSAMLEGLFALSSATRDTLQREWVDLSRLASDVLEDLAAADPTADPCFDIEPGIVAWGDPRLLAVVLQNLLGNAWKYGAGRGRRVEIRFSAERRGGEMDCCVADNGPGFETAEGALLFEPFHRLKSTSGAPGSGIGLATVARIVARHGGTVHVEAAPGQGASFHFVLPEPERHGEAG